MGELDKLPGEAPTGPVDERLVPLSKRNVQNLPQAPAAGAQAQEAPAVEAPKGGVYTLTDAISADGPVSETVRLIVRPDGSSAIQRENGDVIDVTNMIRAGFSAERAIAQSLGDDTSGKNVSRNEQNPPKKPEPKAKAQAVEARAPVAGDAAAPADVPGAGSGAVEGGGVKAGDFVKLSSGDDQRVRQLKALAMTDGFTPSRAKHSSRGSLKRQTSQLRSPHRTLEDQKLVKPTPMHKKR